MERPMKRVRDSYSEQIQIVLSPHVNGNMRLFGGQLMQWIDVVAGVVARRHSGHEVTTATVDSLQFLRSAYLNSTMLLVGRVTYVGNTSMEVRVDTYVEELNGSRELANRAYLVMVAIGEGEKPVPVPGLILETEEERREWRLGEERRRARLERRRKDGEHA